MLGTDLAPKLFAIALIAAGQSSTLTGTLAGQIVMEGYLQLRINPWVRRLLTRLLAIVPAVISHPARRREEADNLLVLSQVSLSVQLGFAIIPLIHFVSDKTTMGAFTIRPHIRVLAWACAGVLIWLNMKLVIEETAPFMAAPGHLQWKIAVGLLGLAGLALLAYIMPASLYEPSDPAVGSAGASSTRKPAGLDAPVLPAYRCGPGFQRTRREIAGLCCRTRREGGALSADPCGGKRFRTYAGKGKR